MKHKWQTFINRTYNYSFKTYDGSKKLPFCLNLKIIISNIKPIFLFISKLNLERYFESFRHQDLPKT